MLTGFYGDAKTLRRDASRTARQSLPFFAQRVLGLRLSADRLTALQGGEAPATALEQKAADAWSALHAGRIEDLPAFARWVFGNGNAA